MKSVSEKTPESNLILDDILSYATRLGWYVLPCSGKVPLLKSWVEEASNDPAQIRGWSETWPDCNWGVNCGKSGLVVLDGDTGAYQSLKPILDAAGAAKPPMTPMCRTAKGHHVYYRGPGFPVRNRVRLLPGIDIRAAGGQAILPPSIHPETGTPYQWVLGRSPFEVEVAPCPEWLVRLLRDHDRTGAEREPIPVADVWNGLPEHQRDVELFQFLRRICRGGATLRDVEQLALTMHERCEKGEHPFTREDALKCARSAFSYRELPEGEEENGLEIWDCDDPEPRAIIQGFLKEGSALFAGRAKAGKSWIALEMALSVCTGRPCFGHFPVQDQGEVLYIDLEDSKTNTRDRLKKLLQDDRHEGLLRLRVKRSWPLGQAAINALEEDLSDHPDTKLVIVDTLIGVREGRTKNQDPYDFDYRAIQGFSRIADRFHVAIVLIHHFNKARDVSDLFDKISGSTGIQAAPHTLIAYDGKRDARGGKVAVTGKRSKEMMFAVERTDNERPVWQDAREFQRSEIRTAILKLLEDAGLEGLSKSDIAKELDRKPGSVKARLHAMLNDGEVLRVGNGTGTRYAAVPEGNESSLEGSTEEAAVAGS